MPRGAASTLPHIGRAPAPGSTTSPARYPWPWRPRRRQSAPAAARTTDATSVLHIDQWRAGLPQTAAPVSMRVQWQVRVQPSGNQPVAFFTEVAAVGLNGMLAACQRFADHVGGVQLGNVESCRDLVNVAREVV